MAQPAPQVAAAVPAGSGGFGAVSGSAAAAFRVPSDVELVRTWRDAKHDLTYSRYQQYVQPHDAAVDGAQLTVVKRGSTVVLVIGAYYPNLKVKNQLRVTGNAAARAAAEDKKVLRNANLADGGPESAPGQLKQRVQLWLNPSNGRLFQQVESGVMGQNFVHQVDAETGEIIESWESTMDAGTGVGVKGDAKNLAGLTTKVSATSYQLKSTDSRVQTRNGSSTSNLNTAPLMTDANDTWDGSGQRTGVDAQFYTALTDKWYRDHSLFDLVSDCTATATSRKWVDDKLHSIVHYNYGQYRFNAFFDDIDGRFGYGDGDSISYLPFTAGQDVVSHELTHRVTECRAPLEYFSWSGALNESISDIMATAIEWDTNEANSTGCKRAVGQAACPDWWLGEDVVLGADWAFRNLADPTVFNDPSHWDDRFCPSVNNFCSDGGGVHINSLIPGHAFYLMVNGGRNARCSGPTDPQADCDVVVPPIPIDDAASIMFAGWGLLPNPTPGNNAAFNRQFCNAHAATVYEAALMFPGSAVHTAAVDLAWTAVGRGYGPDTTAPGDDCQPTSVFSGSTQPPAFAPHITPRSIVIAPNNSGSLDVTPANGSHTLSVSGGGAATVVYDQANTEIDITVPDGMANGTYPLLLSETNGTDTAYAGATLIVDTNPPTASVDGVALGSGQVGTGGGVPLIVNWSASDAESGVASAALQRSPNGVPPPAWANVGSGAGATNTNFSSTGATEFFRVNVTDSANNSFTSPASGPWNIGRAQENGAGVTYKGVWSVMPSSPSFGTTRFTTKRKAWVRYEFTGTDIAFVTTRASGRGKVKIYIDGVFKKKISLGKGTLGQRQIAYRLSGLTNGIHAIRVVNVTGGKRIDVDGFLTLSH